MEAALKDCFHIQYSIFNLQYSIFHILFAQRPHALLCRLSGLDGSVGVELHFVDAHLAVDAWLLIAFDIVFVYAVINNIPFVLARYLQHAVVGSSVDFVLSILNEDYWVLGYRDRS